ncbi:hypothetical protein L9F63_012794, partial [Diploptera punctata]
WNLHYCISILMVKCYSRKLKHVPSLKLEFPIVPAFLRMFGDTRFFFRNLQSGVFRVTSSSIYGAESRRYINSCKKEGVLYLNRLSVVSSNRLKLEFSEVPGITSNFQRLQAGISRRTYAPKFVVLVLAVLAHLYRRLIQRVRRSHTEYVYFTFNFHPRMVVFPCRRLDCE